MLCCSLPLKTLGRKRVSVSHWETLVKAKFGGFPTCQELSWVLGGCWEMGNTNREWPGKLQPFDFRLGQWEGIQREETKIVKD